MKITVNNKQYELEDLLIKGLSAEEQETTVNISRADDFLTVYTSDNTYLTKLKKLVAANPNEWEIIEIIEAKGVISGIKLKAPKNLVSFREKSVSREMSEEQRAAAAERLKSSRKTRS